MSRRDKDDGSWDEDGQSIIRGWPKGRAGRAPGRGERGQNPRGYSRLKAGPTRGHSRAPGFHDRRGGWFFRGPR
jgi:hypothetical protein